MTPSIVYITGLMGAGKSTAGPLLADRLGYRFLDLDAEVEAIVGRPIAELFATRGEDVFRALETAVLCDIARQQGVIVATGGGALATEANLLTARESGFIVYLRLPPATLAQRLLSDQHGRPLLRGDDGEPLTKSQLLRRLDELLRRREPFYRQADLVVEAEGLRPEEVAERVALALQEVQPKP